MSGGLANSWLMGGLSYELLYTQWAYNGWMMALTISRSHVKTESQPAQSALTTELGLRLSLGEFCLHTQPQWCVRGAIFNSIIAPLVIGSPASMR